MSSFVVRGGVPLVGTVRVGGAKNASLPLLFATLLTRGVSRIRRVPDIGDVRVALSILSSYGAEICRVTPDTYEIDTRNLCYTVPDAALVQKLRASTYLLGASLARFGRAVLQPFGGCAFSARPIDMHLGAIRTFGGTVCEDSVRAERLRAGHVVFPKISVGATVNALLLAVAAEGESVLENVAREPHVDALIEYLRCAGADIAVRGGRINVRGGRELHGADAAVIPDMIEAGTYLLCGLMTGGDVTVEGIPTVQLASLTCALTEAGASVLTEKESVRAVGQSLLPISVTAAPYPAFPTDLQPPMAALMAAHGGGEILDTVFPERHGYTDSLAAFGVRASFASPFIRILPSNLHAACVRAPDLRGGAAALLCALRAKGESRVWDAHIIQRGYEHVEKKLSSLGACIRTA